MALAGLEEELGDKAPIARPLKLMRRS